MSRMAMQQGEGRIVLASASRARRTMLENAGLSLDVVASSIDEEVVGAALRAAQNEVSAEDLAEILARAKAEDVSSVATEGVVIGADQVLACDGRLFTKPLTIDGVRDQLLELRGRTHELVSAVALASNGEVVWAHVETARVTLRTFSMKALGGYLAAAGPDVVGCVGGYQFEGPGVQLIDRVEGDYFTVLGLPLMAVLAELRRRGHLID